MFIDNTSYIGTNRSTPDFAFKPPITPDEKVRDWLKASNPFMAAVGLLRLQFNIFEVIQ